MKKTLLAFVMSVIMIAMASCGGNDHSKAFNECKKIIDNVSDAVKEAKTCDDLDMAAFGILGMLGVEGIDAMSEQEQKELDELSAKMETLMTQKKAELNCKEDESLWEDEDMPVDEPVEEVE